MASAINVDDSNVKNLQNAMQQNITQVLAKEAIMARMEDDVRDLDRSAAKWDEYSHENIETAGNKSRSRPSKGTVGLGLAATGLGAGGAVAFWRAHQSQDKRLRKKLRQLPLKRLRTLANKHTIAYKDLYFKNQRRQAKILRRRIYKHLVDKRIRRRRRLYTGVGVGATGVAAAAIGVGMRRKNEGVKDPTISIS